MLKYVICFAVLITVAISETATPPPFKCDPILDCKNATQGDKVPDPEDCTKFYVCIAGSGTGCVPTDSSFPCPTNQFFNQSLTPTDCTDEPTPGTCENLCKNIPPSVCNTTCTDFKFESVAYAGDCSKYYVCTPSGPLEQSCISPNMYYNGAVCVADKSECCDFCTVYCTEELIEIPDPYDCTSFYFCIAVGPPDDNYHSKCTSGNYFNPDTGNCVPGTDCISTCSNSTDSNPTTPSTVTSITSTTPDTASITSTPAGSTNVTTKSTDSATTTPTISTTSNGCQNTYVCTVNGNFPRCSYCDPTYFNCQSGSAVIMTCDTGKVFNTNPAFPYCIIPSNCPYPN